MNILVDVNQREFMILKALVRIVIKTIFRIKKECIIESNQRKGDKMTTDILIEKRNVYGNELIYPLTHIEAIYALTGHKTLSMRKIKALQALGVNFIERPMVVLQGHN
ncbi:hypothetical protein LCGC14_2172140 [marine sediment metagenome]|uniref:Uncharacterized protein n=1 Tax=marine sediment metagenome TaxID=412755 RepID=A0A0F9G2F2_9ZZZZ